MSEHFQIQSKIDYIHTVSGENFEMSYCHFCKKNCHNVGVFFHQGIESNYIEFKCNKCRKIIWVSEINIKREKLNNKCFVCKKPTSWHNANCISISLGNKYKYFCSKNCNKEFSKRR